MPAGPTHVFLYEIYRDRAAFDLHLASDHFRQFDQRSRDLVVSKTVVQPMWSRRTPRQRSDMSGDVSALDLFGTDEPIAPRRVLTAGPLTAILEDGNLRTICFAGIEAVRAINYLARDDSWGTYKAVQSNLEIIESDSSFTVTYDALCSGPNGRYAYRMTITGEASGVLTMEAVGEALTDFATNRTGFVVLHPSEAAGGRLTIRHSDGQIEETCFPRRSAPTSRPSTFPRSRTSRRPASPAPSRWKAMHSRWRTSATGRMHRSRPISARCPSRGLTSSPRVEKIASGSRSRSRLRPWPSQQERPTDARLVLGAPAGRMPSMALFLDPDELPSALAHAASLGTAQDVIIRFDAERGHDWRTLCRPPTLPGRSARGWRSRRFSTLSIRKPRRRGRRRDQVGKCRAGRRPGFTAPRIQDTAIEHAASRRKRTIGELVDALRAAGLKASIGAGTPSFFTEFNRNPPTGDCDFVFFSVASNVHAADDLSVMETLSVYPAVIASARKLCPGKTALARPLHDRHAPQSLRRRRRGKPCSMSVCRLQATTLGMARCSARPSPSVWPRGPPQPASTI